MARLISAPHGNLTVTGDPYQSIYSFRGAELSNIAEFEDAERIVLAESFRVPAEIMDAALRVVAGSGAWGRRNFARWMFEDEPRAIITTPSRWHRRFLKRPGAYVTPR